MAFGLLDSPGLGNEGTALEIRQLTCRTTGTAFQGPFRWRLRGMSTSLSGEPKQREIVVSAFRAGCPFVRRLRLASPYLTPHTAASCSTKAGFGPSLDPALQPSQNELPCFAEITESAKISPLRRERRAKAHSFAFGG